MTSYVDTNRLEVMLREYTLNEDSEAYSDLETEGILQGENWVTRYLHKHLPTYTIPGSSVPAAIVDAATFRSAAAILTVLSSNHEQINAAVKSWQIEAQECLDSFIDDYLSDEEEPDPTKHVASAVSISFPD